MTSRLAPSERSDSSRRELIMAGDILRRRGRTTADCRREDTIRWQATQKEVSMRQYTTPMAILAALFVGYFAANRTVPVQAQSGGSHAAVANDLGSLESTGPYEVVPNWP